MLKIPTLFERDYHSKRNAPARNEVTPGCEWVLAGEGVATRKWDGTCCMVRGGRLYARYDSHGKTPPPDFEPAEAGHRMGWVPVTDAPQWKWHNEADLAGLEDGTYELLGPKVQGNPEGMPRHVLLRHGAEVLPDAPRDFDGLRDYFSCHDIEGIVWHHPDGRMAKLRLDAFCLRRPLKARGTP